MAENGGVAIPRLGRMMGGQNRFNGEKPKNAQGAFKRLAALYFIRGKAVFPAMLLAACSAGLGVSFPYLIGRAFDTFNAANMTVDRPQLLYFLSILSALYAVNWAAATLSGTIMLRVSQKLVFSLRDSLFEKLQHLPLAFFDTHPHGDTMSRLTNDADNISSTISQAVTQFITGVLTLAGSITVMLSMSIPLALTAMSTLPLVVLLTKIIATHSRKYYRLQQKSLGRVNGMIEENIQGLKMVKAFSRQRETAEEFGVANDELKESGTRAQIWAGYLMPLMNVLGNLIFALIALVGGILSIRSGVSVGTVVSFLSYARQFSTPLAGLAAMFNTIQSALAGAERVFEILDEPEETKDADNATDISGVKGQVVFKDVSFSYDKAHIAAQDISFHIEPGETVALVGETGAGKTTVVNLLTRFYDADSGQIFIDGTEINEIRRDSLRKCFSVVLQDTCLFSGTIGDNIRYGMQDASDDQVREAAHLARASRFIEQLPEGYDTLVSGSTDTLSEGQRQLLAIARAVLCDRPILILDEATSSVDTKTEKAIQKALTGLMQGRTSFLIAHRLSTIRDADRIMVIGRGTILEIGNHSELMQNHGPYYEMVVSQLGRATA